MLAKAELLSKLSLIKNISCLSSYSLFDCRNEMAKVEYAFPVEKIHGKVAKHHKVGFAHRVASKLNYTQAYGKRSTPVTKKETDHRTKFGIVSTATAARLADPTKMQADQLAYKAQTKYKTLRQYVFNQEWLAYTPV